MIVVDTNIIAYMIFKTPQSEAVERLHEANPVWHVPVLWSGEFLNITALYLRAGLIDFAKAIDVSQRAFQLVGLNEHRVAPANIMDFVKQSDCSSYDCEFIALAQGLETKLVTYDRKILREFPQIAIKPEDYLAQPS